MIRSIALALLMIPIYADAQSSVEALGKASDAGQQVFDGNPNDPAQGRLGKIFKQKEVDTPPSYPGGGQVLVDHLAHAEGCGALPRMEDCFGSSKLVLDFVVNADGTVSDVEFSREGCEVLQGVVLCAMRGLELWTPAMKNGVPVRMRQRETVKYDLR